MGGLSIATLVSALANLGPILNLVNKLYDAAKAEQQAQETIDAAFGRVLDDATQLIEKARVARAAVAAQPVGQLHDTDGFRRD